MTSSDKRSDGRPLSESAAPSKSSSKKVSLLARQPRDRSGSALSCSCCACWLWTRRQSLHLGFMSILVVSFLVLERSFQATIQEHHQLVWNTPLALETSKKPVAAPKNHTLPTVESRSNHSNQVLKTQRSSALSTTPVNIVFELKRHVAYNNTFNPEYKCTVGPNRSALPPHLQEPLDGFSTWIPHTKLNLIFMGDSVGIHMAQMYEEASYSRQRTVFRYSWHTREGLSLAHLQGGGLLAQWRITKLLLRQNEGKQLPNSGEGGWIRPDARSLKNHKFDNTQTTPRRFHAMVFRIPHGWIGFDEITPENLIETLELAHELLQVDTVIVPALTIVNNVQSVEEMDELDRTNHMIRQVAQNWKPTPKAPKLTHVMVLDFDKLTTPIVETNARHLGYEVRPNRDYHKKRLSNRIRCHSGSDGYKRLIPHICSEKVPPGHCDCRRNSISYDGMHWCMEHLGARVNAGIACLLGCRRYPITSFRDCEVQCNRRFMSLKPLPIADPDWTSIQLSAEDVLNWGTDD